MPRHLPRRSRLNDVLDLHTLIEHTRSDLVEAKHVLAEIRMALRRVELAVGVSELRLDQIAAIYNRLVDELEPRAPTTEPGRARRAKTRGDREGGRYPPMAET
jgi:hypothetical protein